MAIIPSEYSRRPCASLPQLAAALQEDIAAGAQSFVPECTTCKLSLDQSALISLLRPSIGPYAEGGIHDLPSDFKVFWTQSSDSRKSHPQATVGTITMHGDARARQIVQRAASRGIVAAIEAVDGFKYSFNNGWGAKDDEGQRFSYICQDSMQNKDRHANGFARTQKHLKGGESGARKPTFDCKGSIGVKFSFSRRSVDVHYTHYAIHGPVSDKDGKHATPRETSTQDVHLSSSTTEVSQRETSNIGRPLKRKRDTVVLPSNGDRNNLPLVELLKQSERTGNDLVESPVTSNAIASKHQISVDYELPSWAPQSEPSAGDVRSRWAMRAPTKPDNFSRAQSHATLPSPPPYLPTSSARTQRNRTFEPLVPYEHTQHQLRDHTQAPLVSSSQPAQTQPRTGTFQPPKPPPSQNQGLFTTLKPTPTKDPPGPSVNPNYACHGRRSCLHCRYLKKNCDEERPICGSCRKAGRNDCTYDGSSNYLPAPLWTLSSNVEIG